MGGKFEECHLEKGIFKDQYGNAFNKNIEKCTLISEKQYREQVEKQRELSRKNITDIKRSIPLTFEYSYKYTKDKYINVKQTPDILSNLKIFYKNNINSFNNSPSLKKYLKNIAYNSRGLDNFVSNIGNALHPFSNGNLTQGVKNLFGWWIPWDTPEVQKSLKNFTTNLKNDYKNGEYTIKTADSFNSMCLLFSYQFIGKKFDKDNRYNNWSENQNGKNKTGNNFQENQKKRELTNKELYDLGYKYKDALGNNRYKVMPSKGSINELHKYLGNRRSIKTGSVNTYLYSKKKFYLEKSDIKIKKIYYIESLKSRKPKGGTALLDYTKSKLKKGDVIVLTDEATNHSTGVRMDTFYESRGFRKYTNEDGYEFCFFIKGYSIDKVNSMTIWELKQILRKARLTWH